MLTSRGLGTVLGDLAALGFDARWGVISAANLGAPHLRERIWIVAHNNSESQSTKPIDAKQVCKSDMADTDQQHRGGKSQQSNNNFGEKIYHEFSGGGSKMADADGAQCKGNKCAERSIKERTDISKSSWWASEPDVGRVANGVAARVDRLKAIGNGQVPRVAATAFKLMEAI
jgi:DNA (cytosine-5)-methyltransferase 1